MRYQRLQFLFHFNNVCLGKNFELANLCARERVRETKTTVYENCLSSIQVT